MTSETCYEVLGRGNFSFYLPLEVVEVFERMPPRRADPRESTGRDATRQIRSFCVLRIPAGSGETGSKSVIWNCEGV